MTSHRDMPPAEVVFEPEFIEGVRQIFEEKIVFNQVLGLKVKHIAPTHCEAEIVMRPELVGHFSYQRIHGGVISAGLDAMGGLAVMAAMGAKHMDEPPFARLHRFAKLGTIDLRIDYMRPGIGERFTLKAEVLKLGGRVANTRMGFHAANGQLLAAGSAAYIVS